MRDKNSYNQFGDDYLDKLDAKLSGGKQPIDLVPYKRTIEEFTNHFVPLYHQIKNDIELLVVFKASGCDRFRTALELGISLNTLKNRIRVLKKKLRIKADSPRLRRTKRNPK